MAIRSTMNRGLTELLKKAFPNVQAVKRPCVGIGQIEQVQWMAGFASGEGCFYISIRKISTTKPKSSVEPRFILTQHTRDESLMRRCIDFFQAGSVIQNRNTYNFSISKFADLFTKVLPMFKKAPILGTKSKDFNDWSEVLHLMNTKEHLSQEGLSKIRKIKEGMNRGRDRMNE